MTAAAAATAAKGSRAAGPTAAADTGGRMKRVKADDLHREWIENPAYQSR